MSRKWKKTRKRTRKRSVTSFRLVERELRERERSRRRKGVFTRKWVEPQAGTGINGPGSGKVGREGRSKNNTLRRFWVGESVTVVWLNDHLLLVYLKNQGLSEISGGNRPIKPGDMFIQRARRPPTNQEHRQRVISGER